MRAKPETPFQGVPEVGKRDPSAIGGGGQEEGQTHLENQKRVWVKRPRSKSKAEKHICQRADGKRCLHRGGPLVPGQHDRSNPNQTLLPVFFFWEGGYRE